MQKAMGGLLAWLNENRLSSTSHNVSSRAHKTARKWARFARAPRFVDRTSAGKREVECGVVFYV